MIAASNITMRYGKKTLFENVSVKFRPGNRYGLIGANGSGKSTFMKIMTGQLEPTSGEIVIDQGCTLGYLKQDHSLYESEAIIDTVCMGNEALWALHQEREHLYEKTDLTDDENDRILVIEDEYGEAGGYTMEADAARLLSGLGFPEEQHAKPMRTLQGGWRLRVLLAQVLFAKPDILLLDEPTNHLDMASIGWLCGFLTTYEGTVVVISHDRYFLNQVCSHTADLDYQEIRLFTGNYDEFMITNEMLLEKNRKETAQKEKRINELKSFINRFSANASKARQATSRRKELDKIELTTMKPSSRVSPYIRFEPRERLGDKVILAEGIGKTYDDVTLFAKQTFEIGATERIGIVGVNGVGKTTLLKILIGQLAPDTGAVEMGETVQISYFPQESGELIHTDEPAVDWLARYAPGEEGIDETELRSAMGRMLFRGEEALKPVNVLSGGERARLILSKMLLEGGNVLVLDEPTNHLDLESIEALNYALSLVENTVIFVSHDREFVNSLATRVIQIEEGGHVMDYPGNFDEFEAWRKKQLKAAKA